MAKRFQVALSFPGEQRSRVERIADALGSHLGREKVLYDRWHAAEFNRLNLDSYLSKLYNDESDLIVFFVSKEYQQMKWTGLESRAALEVVKRKQGQRLMFLRLDDADIPGLYSIDGSLDIRAMPDGEVVTAILNRLKAPTASGGHRAFTAKLPIVNPTLIGREREMAFLDRAWATPTTNFVQVIAAGGTGKTALVDKWFRRHLGEATVFGWSFYSQGSSPDRQTSSDPFFAEILAWLDIKIAPTASIYAKAEAVASRLREERVLLLLDGVEPLQDAAGALRDAALMALLQELDTANRGLVVCTTRVRLDIPDDAPRAESLDLDNLTGPQGAEYLRRLGVEGTDEELQLASEEFWNHALALTLLGTYLVDFCGGDVRRRPEIPRLTAEDSHAHRVMAAYERMFAGKSELDILRALGYFDRPAEPEALKLVLPPTEERRYRNALGRLHRARLVLTRDPAQPLDCHPLVREHFARETTPDGHARLFEHYKQQAPYLPDTLEEMTPLFHAVYYGCRAGVPQGALDEVYNERILRGKEAYLVYRLGAFGTDLSLLANFFSGPWTLPLPSLSPADQSWVIGQAGFALRAIGRLTDAVAPTRAAAKAHVQSERWRYAATSYSNLSELLLTLGNVMEAVSAARQSVEVSDVSGDGFWRMASRNTLATALHQSGDFASARLLFEASERLQAEFQPSLPILYSLQGYRYCALLIDENRTAEVVRRASQTLVSAQESRRVLDIGLDHLSLGRAHQSGSAESAHHLDQAVEFLRRAGVLEFVVLGLLTRATGYDLDEAFRISSRSAMRLHLADYHLVRGNLMEAEALIKETGYHRRDRDVADLRARVRE